MHETLHFPIPGTDAIVQYEHAPGGALARLSCAGRVYLEAAGGRRVYDDGLATVSELTAGRRLLRQVRAGDAFWVEEYAWDTNGRLELVDGTRVERDASGRVTACATPAGTWRYSYSGHHLSGIARTGAPERRIRRGPDGRATRVDQPGEVAARIHYTATGVRADIPALPATYHRDPWGRLWTVADAGGAILTTYLWEGYRCLARIDGPPGDPLAAVFSLDPTGTPVRAITPHGTLRFPRDAYGEALLGHQGVPGLYGAAVYQGRHYLAERALDSVSGSYGAPDPLDGKAGDPRRAGGYDGPLMVEHPTAGPYAVCQHDPVSRADPTGAFSWWILLTDFTWASQNNMTGLFGLDFIFNFWGSLFSGNIGKFFDREFFYSDRAGTWGWRSDGVIGKITGGRAFAYQHQIWSPSEEFHKLEYARGFVPKAAFKPTYYGTMLRAKPKTGDPLLLMGSGGLTGTRLINWTRAGGRAEPVVPGSGVPAFPEGGLHFEEPISALRTPLDCTMTEVEPLGSLHGGNVGDRTLIDIPTTGLRLAGLVLLTDATKSAYIEEVAAASEQAGKTRVYFPREITGLGPSGVRLRGLGAPSPAENISHGAATPAEYLDAAGTTQPYAAGDPVRLKQGAAVVGAALIDRLEVKLAIDAAFAGLNAPYTVHKATTMGGTTAGKLLADADRFESASPPTVGDLVLVAASGGASLAVAVTERSGNQCRVDRPLQPALGAADAAVTWQPVAVTLTPLGRKDGALEADATLVYKAEATRTGPTGDLVVLRDRDGKRAARRVTALTYDTIVLATPLPGNQANPYSVERFATQAPNAESLTVTRGQSLVLTPAIPESAVSLHLQQFATNAISTGAAISEVGAAAVQFTLTGATAILTVPAAGLNGHDALRPSAVVGLTSGATTTPALVKKVRVSVTLDRQLPLAANGLEVVPLGRVGWPYIGERRRLPTGSLAREVVTVRPRTNVPAPDTRVQMPRFQPGEFVEVDYGPTDGRRLFRIATPVGDPAKPVDGTTLGLDDDFAPALPAAPAVPPLVSVQRVEPVAPNPATGGSRIGIRGAAIGGGGAPTNQAAFDLWAGDGLAVGQQIAIVSGPLAYPAIVRTVDRIELELAPLTTLANGAYTIAGATPGTTVAVPSFTRDGGALVIPSGDLTVGANRLVLAVPFKDGALKADGSLTPGTVLVPDDDEEGELTRLDSLKAHELTHTRQWSAFGPLMLFLFPTFILEGIVEATTEIELPAFSAYVAATIVQEGGGRLLQITSPGAIDFNAGDTVQVSWAAAQPGPSGPVTAPGAGGAQSIVLGAEEPAGSNRFHLTAGAGVIPGVVVNLQVRRQSNDTPGWDGLISFLQVISAGGLMNFIGGAVYGGLFTLIGRGAYALYRLIAGQGKTYPGQVEGTGDDAGKLVRVSDADGREALAGASRVILEKGDTKLVRDVVRIEGEVVRLTQPAGVTGEVRIAPYSSFRPDSTFDWHQYHPASIPDLSRPATVQIEPVDGDALTLKPFDRVQIVRGSTTVGRTVTAASGNSADLDEALPGTETPFRIAKLGESDPIGNFDSVLLTNEYGMDWLRWVFDPYSQLQYRLQPDPSSFAGIMARIGRYAFGASSWSFIWASVLTIDRVHQDEHLARIEQSASSESGDTYSPLGRLRGELSVVGDIARYWQVPLGGLRETDLLISPGDARLNPSWPSGTRGLQDAPGVNLADTTRVMTSLRRSTPAEDSSQLNADVRALGSVSARAHDVPDTLFAKDPADPTTPAASAPNGSMPTGRGRVPSSAQMQRSTGMYVAYCRPGLHRATVLNGIFDGLKGRQAHDKGRQTLWVDKTVAPVVVSLNGQLVNDGDRVTMVQTQRVKASVTPSGGLRTYAATLLRPGLGEVLRSPDAADPLVIEAGRANGTEDVEISRLYRFNTGTGKYDHPVLARHGMHLPADLHIPVRLLTIEVVDTLPVRKALTLATSDIVTELRPNEEGFIIVPAAIGPQGARVVAATAGGAPVAPATLTALAGLIKPAPASIPAEVTAFAGPGGVVRLLFAPALGIAAETDVTIHVQVGASGPPVELKVAVKLRP